MLQATMAARGCAAKMSGRAVTSDDEGVLETTRTARSRSVDTFVACPRRCKTVNRPVLSFDAGALPTIRTFTFEEFGEIVDVSTTLSGLHGSHPDLLTDFALFCEEVTLYLMDP
jgi:hypothetical protein